MQLTFQRVTWGKVSFNTFGWGLGGRFPTYFTMFLGPDCRFPSCFTRVLSPGGRFPSYVTRILGLGGVFYEGFGPGRSISIVFYEVVGPWTSPGIPPKGLCSWSGGKCPKPSVSVIKMSMFWETFQNLDFREEGPRKVKTALFPVWRGEKFPQAHQSKPNKLTFHRVARGKVEHGVSWTAKRSK